MSAILHTDEFAPLQRQQSHRSHDSLLECGNGGDKNSKSAHGYSTLPRAFRVQQQQKQQNLCSDAHLLLPPPAVPPPKSFCCRAHPCCAKKLGGLVKIKAAKSNPELNNLGTKSGAGAKVFPVAMGGVGNGDRRFHQNRHRSPQPISRPHDYLSLLPNSSAVVRQQHIDHHHQTDTCCQRINCGAFGPASDAFVRAEEDCALRKDRAELDWAEADGAPSAIFNDTNELEIGRSHYVNLPHNAQKAARRTNAVRQRMVAEATGISPASSDCSSGVTTPNSGGNASAELPSLTARNANARGTATAREDGTGGGKGR